jgi:C-terminal processing protease CtpA/Prc
VLVNRHSYSNTVMVAAIVQDYGFGRVIGEETADLASTYGAMETFALPRTGIVVGYPKARILRPNGDARARGVIPDVAIETPVVPSREDVVLERALALPASKDVAAERR